MLLKILYVHSLRQLIDASICFALVKVLLLKFVSAWQSFTLDFNGKNTNGFCYNNELDERIYLCFASCIQVALNRILHVKQMQSRLFKRKNGVIFNELKTCVKYQPQKHAKIPYALRFIASCNFKLNYTTRQHTPCMVIAREYIPSHVIKKQHNFKPSFYLNCRFLEIIQFSFFDELLIPSRIRNVF